MKLPKPLLLLAVATGTIAPVVMAADEPTVREIYTCSFNEGKDMGDLMAARDFYLKQMEKAGQEAGTAFVWTPYKAPVDFDFLWANNQPSVMDFATSSDAYIESPEGQAAAERFDSVASCTSHLAMHRQIFQAEGELTPGTNGAVISTLACDYRAGRGADDLIDLNSHIADVMNSLDLDDGGAGYVSVPGVGAGPGMRDVYFYGVTGSGSLGETEHGDAGLTWLSFSGETLRRDARLQQRVVLRSAGRAATGVTMDRIAVAKASFGALFRGVLLEDSIAGNRCRRVHRLSDSTLEDEERQKRYRGTYREDQDESAGV